MTDGARFDESDVLAMLRNAVARRQSDVGTSPSPADDPLVTAADPTGPAGDGLPADHGDVADTRAPRSGDAFDASETEPNGTPDNLRQGTLFDAKGASGEPDAAVDARPDEGERTPKGELEGRRIRVRPMLIGGPASKPKRGRATPDIAAGHRERLRARFDSGDTLADYELLELLLFRSIPRRDTKPIAKALITTFGSFAGAVSAPRSRLEQIVGVGDKVIGDFHLVRAAAERFAHATLAARAVLSTTDAVVEFYQAKLRTAEREEFHVLYLDKKNQMLASECAGTGTVDHTPVYPREIIKRALEHGASGIVLVHNHPSGDPTPSRADIAMTKTIIAAAAPLGIIVHDHLIIGANTYVSLRGDKYL